VTTGGGVKTPAPLLNLQLRKPLWIMRFSISPRVILSASLLGLSGALCNAQIATNTYAWPPDATDTNSVHWFWIGLVLGIVNGGIAWTFKMVRQAGKLGGYEFGFFLAAALCCMGSRAEAANVTFQNPGTSLAQGTIGTFYSGIWHGLDTFSIAGGGSVVKDVSGYVPASEAGIVLNGCNGSAWYDLGGTWNSLVGTTININRDTCTVGSAPPIYGNCQSGFNNNQNAQWVMQLITSSCHGSATNWVQVMPYTSWNFCYTDSCPITAGAYAVDCSGCYSTAISLGTSSGNSSSGTASGLTSTNGVTKDQNISTNYSGLPVLPTTYTNINQVFLLGADAIIQAENAFAARNHTDLASVQSSINSGNLTLANVLGELQSDERMVTNLAGGLWSEVTSDSRVTTNLLGQLENEAKTETNLLGQLKLTNHLDLANLGNVISNQYWGTTQQYSMGYVSNTASILTAMGAAASMVGSNQLASLGVFDDQVVAAGGDALTWDINVATTLGHTETIHLNPFSHDWVTDLCMITTAIVKWGSLIGLILAASKIVTSGIENAGVMRQASAASAVPGVSSGTAVGMAVAMTVAIGVLPALAYTVISGWKGSLSAPIPVPSTTAIGWSIYALQKFIPVQYVVVNIINLIAFRFTWTAILFVAQTIVRFLVG
jgi:hypothetical protein